jgi:hypothetical protein
MEKHEISQKIVQISNRKIIETVTPSTHKYKTTLFPVLVQGLQEKVAGLD